MRGFRELLRASPIARLTRIVMQTHAQVERLQIAVGRLEGLVRAREPGGFKAHEYGVFSQWGEDGLIAYLTAHVPIEHRSFVEFGVENYREANTRFLLVSQNWRGLVIDGSQSNIRDIKEDDVSWRHELDARCAFVTRDNINHLLRDAGFTGDIGLLSIDIDGNDYWVWEAIDVVSPRIVVVEYNSLFGATRAVTVPYDAEFVRERKHHSRLYYGASLGALTKLGARKGYALVGSNEAGNNAFFVRDDVLGKLPRVAPELAYRRATFREGRNAEGTLTFDAFAARARAISQLPVYDLDRAAEVSIESLGLS
jgi:hypothetical protein